MKPFKRLWIVPATIIGFAIMMYFVQKDWNTFMSDYEEASIGSPIDGRIKDIIIERGVGYVKLETGEGYFFYTAKNFLYTPNSFQDFIKTGDSLCKKANTDTVFVKRDSKEYIFALSRYLNE